MSDLRNVGHGACPCHWCDLIRRKPDATPLEKYDALKRTEREALDPQPRKR